MARRGFFALCGMGELMDEKAQDEGVGAPMTKSLLIHASHPTSECQAIASISTARYVSTQEAEI